MLNARSVQTQAVFQLFLYGPVVLVFVHVDEVDYDQTGKITQAHLAAGFFGRFEICAKCRLLDIAFARRLA